jgi:hypothetical protein
MSGRYYVINDRLIVICSGFMTRGDAYRWIIKNGGEWKPWFIAKDGS